MAQVPVRLELLYQLLERQILVIVGVYAYLPHVSQELSECRIPGHVGPQHLGVDEEPYQGLNLHAVAVSGRGPDQHVLLPGIPVQHGLEGCQQRREQRRPLAQAQPPHPLRQPRVDHE